MKKLTFISKQERAWQPLTASDLSYSIVWNDLSGLVKVILPCGREIHSGRKTANNACVAMGLGEEILREYGYEKQIKRGEYNARIPIIKLE